MKTWISSLFNHNSFWKSKISRPFLIGNLGLFIIAFILLIYPNGISWLNARNRLMAQRQVYATYTRRVQEYHDTPQTTESVQNILPYEMITAMLGEVLSIASRYNLHKTHFDASDPVGTDMHGTGFVEVSVSFTLSGAPHDGAGFVAELANSSAFVHSIRMDFVSIETAILRGEFSLFAFDE